MALVGTFTKQPAEKLDYDFDFSQFLGDDNIEAVLNPPVAVATPSGLSVDTVIALPNGKSVKVWLSGGANGVTYKVELTVQSNGGRIKQSEIRVRVKEV